MFSPGEPEGAVTHLFPSGIRTSAPIGPLGLAKEEGTESFHCGRMSVPAASHWDDTFLRENGREHHTKNWRSKTVSGAEVRRLSEIGKLQESGSPASEVVFM